MFISLKNPENKQRELHDGGINSLLEYLGVKKGAEGAQKVDRDIELVASVPFFKEQLTIGNEENQDGIAWTLSTFDLDRYAERIDPQGWDFSQFMKNPVVEWAHRSDIPAIGRIDSLNIDDKGLHGLVVFNGKDYDPFGWSIGERVKAGVIRAGSVGFRVMEIEIPSKEDSRDGTALIFRKQELLEFSICNVPANPFALAKSMQEAKTETAQDFIYPNFWGGVINNL